WNLALVAPALELPGQLNDLGRSGGSDRMTSRNQATAGIDRLSAPEPCLAVQDQPRSFAGPAQPELLVELELGDRGGVVELDDIQVVRPQPSPFIGQTRGPRDGVRLRPVVASARGQDRRRNAHPTPVPWA